MPQLRRSLWIGHHNPLYPPWWFPRSIKQWTQQRNWSRGGTFPSNLVPREVWGVHQPWPLPFLSGPDIPQKELRRSFSFFFQFQNGLSDKKTSNDIKEKGKQGSMAEQTLGKPPKEKSWEKNRKRTSGIKNSKKRKMGEPNSPTRRGNKQGGQKVKLKSGNPWLTGRIL